MEYQAHTTLSIYRRATGLPGAIFLGSMLSLAWLSHHDERKDRFNGR
jgi:hypothetical protein